MVTNLPRLDPQAYAYEHADTRSFAEEAEEWFPYSDDERYMLLRGKEAFETQWERWQGGGTASKWTQVEDKDRELFLQHVIETVSSKDEDADGVECLAYLAMGCWGETAGVEEEKSEEKGVENPETGSWGGMEQGQPTKSATQIKWIRKGCEMLVGYGAAQVLFKVLRKACDGEQSVGPLPPLDLSMAFVFDTLADYFFAEKLSRLQVRSQRTKHMVPPSCIDFLPLIKLLPRYI